MMTIRFIPAFILAFFCLIFVALAARPIPLGAPSPDSIVGRTISVVSQFAELSEALAPGPGLSLQSHKKWTPLRIVANVLGGIGIAVGITPVLPQFWKHYKEKSAKALSMDMFAYRMAADMVNLTGSVLCRQPWFIIVQNSYFNLETIIFALQSLYYKKKNNDDAIAAGNADSDTKASMKVSKKSITITSIIVTVPILMFALGCTVFKHRLPKSSLLNMIGTFCLWASYVLMVSGRFPQLYRVWKIRSVDGISKKMYLLGIASNTLAATSVLLENVSKHTPITKMLNGTAAIIFGSYFAIVLDLIFLYMYYLFNKPKTDAAVPEDGPGLQVEDAEFENEIERPADGIIELDPQSHLPEVDRLD